MRTYLDDYFFFDPELLPSNPVMMEIGTFSPDCAEAMFNVDPLSRVFLVEADERSARKLAQLYETRRPVHVCVLHYALAENDGPVTLYKYGSRNASSIFTRKRHKTGEEEVSGKCLNSLIDLAKIKRGITGLDILLMNCEGAELYALQELIRNPNLRSHVRPICVGSYCSNIYLTRTWNDVAITPGVF